MPTIDILERNYARAAGVKLRERLVIEELKVSTQTDTGHVTVADVKIAVQMPPKFLRPNFQGMPPELKLLKLWVLWIAVWTGSKWTKRPIQPSGFGAKITNPKHWSSFDRVKQAYERA